LRDQSFGLRVETDRHVDMSSKDPARARRLLARASRCVRRERQCRARQKTRNDQPMS
jgi:hypothetical protein